MTIREAYNNIRSMPFSKAVDSTLEFDETIAVDIDTRCRTIILAVNNKAVKIDYNMQEERVGAYSNEDLEGTDKVGYEGGS